MSTDQNVCPNTLIAGERLRDIMQAAQHFKLGEERDGLIRVTARMPTPTLVPLMRAMMRVEADLLLGDACEITEETPEEPRTHEQRRCDALVELFRRINELLVPRSEDLT